jgi:hypothetical protein
MFMQLLCLFLVVVIVILMIFMLSSSFGFSSFVSSIKEKIENGISAIRKKIT